MVIILPQCTEHVYQCVSFDNFCLHNLSSSSVIHTTMKLFFEKISFLNPHLFRLTKTFIDNTFFGGSDEPPYCKFPSHYYFSNELLSMIDRYDFGYDRYYYDWRHNFIVPVPNCDLCALIKSHQHYHIPAHSL